jgi:hypothetical protein
VVPFDSKPSGKSPDLRFGRNPWCRDPVGYILGCSAEKRSLPFEDGADAAAWTPR